MLNKSRFELKSTLNHKALKRFLNKYDLLRHKAHVKIVVHTFIRKKVNRKKWKTSFDGHSYREVGFVVKKTAAPPGSSFQRNTH